MAHLTTLVEKDFGGISRPVGKPPLGVKKTTVRLPPEALAEIEGLVGKHRLATFIREAVQEALERRRNTARGSSPDRAKTR